jgi:trans-aconitate 2-methyltransferase
VALDPKELQELMDELKASRASRQNAWSILQELRAVLSETAGIELQPPAWKSHRLSDRYTNRTHTPGEYYDWLAPLSKQLQLWETVYFHELANHEAIVEFYSSTGLKPYLEGLPSDELKDQFKASVLEAFCNLVPTQRNGKVLFPFRRIFLIAVS